MTLKSFSKNVCKKTTLSYNSSPKTTPRRGNTSKNQLLCIFKSYLYFQTTLKRCSK